ncbi:MAG: class I SAM-dependent methyltransferase [Chloroflexi bacterium]|nr:class I SAM-dependent methyltransferase [Chloroflexota bacterium]MBU1751970.1 class I SAM-dependent methyltransferase [Chloroflexota bacterium]
MEEYPYSGSYDDPLLAELYDREETYTDDVALIRKLIALIGDAGSLNTIVEPFSGTGRILVPLAQDGHHVTGIEMAPAMNARAAAKVAALGDEVQARVALKTQDVLDGDWGAGYDLVILGGNAFYELPSAEAQERCIRLAHEALAPGGHLFVDNNDYKGDWGRLAFGKEHVVLEGTGADGTYGRYALTSLRFDEDFGVLHLKRTWLTRTPAGVEQTIEYVGRKHPVSAGEVEGWLRAHGFSVVQMFGDRQGNPYTPPSERAIFWARKT